MKALESLLLSDTVRAAGKDCLPVERDHAVSAPLCNGSCIAPRHINTCTCAACTSADAVVWERLARLPSLDQRQLAAVAAHPTGESVDGLAVDWAGCEVSTPSSVPPAHAQVGQVAGVGHEVQVASDGGHAVQLAGVATHHCGLGTAVASPDSRTPHATRDSSWMEVGEGGGQQA